MKIDQFVDLEGYISTLTAIGKAIMSDNPRLNVLFVCAKNQWRSPTAAAIYQNDARLAVQSAGLSQRSPCVISAKLLTWADIVMVMEHAHASRIRDRFRTMVELPETISLEIPDDFPFMDAELIKLLEAAVEEVLENRFH